MPISGRSQSPGDHHGVGIDGSDRVRRGLEQPGIGGRVGTWFPEVLDVRFVPHLPAFDAGPVVALGGGCGKAGERLDVSGRMFVGCARWPGP